MVQRIAISDPRLRKLVDSAVSDLEEFYPDKRIRSLNKLHKGLCNRVGELWPQVGYASRDDFFAAYGFESDHSYNAAGGRPTTLDPEKLIAELEARYEGAPKPKTIGILMFENPDIKGQLKSLQNKSNELFGRSLAKEFKDRGLLAERSASSEVTDGDIQAMLDHLTAKYANAVTKPSTKSELEADNPGYEDVIAGFYDRSESIYGVKPRRKLIESGVYAKPATCVPDVDVREIEDAVIELGEMLCDLPSDEKPKTIADLAKAYPNQGERIKAGNKMGVLDKELLQRLGILAPARYALKKWGIRFVAAEELLPLFVGVSSETYIDPQNGTTAYLPPTVLGIDAKEGVELRTALVSIKGPAARSANIGDTFETEMVTLRDEFGKDCEYVQIKTDRLGKFVPRCSLGLFKGAVDAGSSRLARFAGATVVAKSEHEGRCVAQIEFNYLAELRSDTMVYVLREMGIVIDRDLAGGMGWRFRMQRALGRPILLQGLEVNTDETEIEIKFEADIDIEIGVGFELELDGGGTMAATLPS